MNRTKKKFLVVGGDLRQARLCDLLYEEGHRVGIYALDRQTFDNTIKTYGDLQEGAQEADCIILPLPVLREEDRLNAPLSNKPHRIEEILKAIPAGKLVVGGNASPEVLEAAEKYGLIYVDYFKREELAVLNAIPAAEGAVQIAMEELPVTIHGTKCLVIGHGRIGKILARMLRGLGAQVTVAARKYADYAWIYAEGHHSVYTGEMDETLKDTQAVFNTVPKQLLGRAQLLALPRDALVIDLASKPGGVDMNAAQELGVRVIWALSLPGKVAPVTSAAAIRNTVYHILEERGELVV